MSIVVLFGSSFSHFLLLARCVRLAPCFVVVSTVVYSTNESMNMNEESINQSNHVNL